MGSSLTATADLFLVTDITPTKSVGIAAPAGVAKRPAFECLVTLRVCQFLHIFWMVSMVADHPSSPVQNTQTYINTKVRSPT